MNFDAAIRLTEILLGFSFLQQSIEHLNSFTIERRIFLVRIVLSIFLIIGFQSAWIILLLLLLALVILQYFHGPYNGGADRMSLLILICLCLVHFSPTHMWKEIAFAYLAVQLILSYFISGWVKVINPDWRKGIALRDVFQFTAYPVSESIRSWYKSSQALFFMSWGVIAFELLFPLSLISSVSLVIALFIAATFHLANAFLFGLNRFFWIWITAFPSIFWFQHRLFSG